MLAMFTRAKMRQSEQYVQRRQHDVGPTAFLPAGQRWPDSDKMTLSQHPANVMPTPIRPCADVLPTLNQRYANLDLFHRMPTSFRHWTNVIPINPFLTMCRRTTNVMPTSIPPCTDVVPTLDKRYANPYPTMCRRLLDIGPTLYQPPFNHVPTSPRRRANVIPTPIPPCADVVPTLDQRYANPYPTMCRRRGLLRWSIVANMMLGQQLSCRRANVARQRRNDIKPTSGQRPPDV